MQELFTKDDLRFQDYLWNTNMDSYKLKDTPDRNLFSPSEGYEVLYMINFAADQLGLKTKEEALLIERLLHDKLPINKWSQVNVYKWLQKEMEAELTGKVAE